MNLNTILSALYRTMAVTFLSSIFSVAAIYAFLIVFFILSSSWGTPLILSPSQTKVLSFQPQVATLSLNLNKQKAELITALQTKQSILEQLIQIDTIAIKIEDTMLIEKNRTDSTVVNLNKLIADKRKNIRQTDNVLQSTKILLEQLESELKVGLITSDQAAQRRITLQAANNSLTDLNISATQLETQAIQLKDYAATLSGSNKTLLGLAPLKQLMELNALKTELKLQLNIGERNLDIINKSMASDNRILQTAMDSPYYRALWAPTPVLFIPYNNIKYAVENAPVYDCFLQVIFCKKVGIIEKLFDAEEYAKHPLFKTDLKGRLAAVTFSDKQAANSSVLFIGSKPLLI